MTHNHNTTRIVIIVALLAGLAVSAVAPPVARAAPSSSYAPDVAQEAAQPAAATQVRVQAALGQLPLYFVENRGQTDARVAYTVQGRDTTLYFTAGGVTMALTGPAGGECYGFQVGAYNPSRALVIDPAVLVYAGYIGGSYFDYGMGIAVDGAGHAYVTGGTSSTEAQGFPVSVGPDLTHNGGIVDAFVAKIGWEAMPITFNRVAGHITHDQNGDGLLNLKCQGSDVTPAGCEPGLENAQASVDGLVYTTNTSGWYSFNLLDPGAYTVLSAPPAGSWWTPTTPETCDVTIANTSDQVFCNFGYWWGLDGPPVDGLVAQQQVTLLPVQDTTITRPEPGNHGFKQNLWVRQPGLSSTLVQFDLSGLPAGAEIVWAKLRLYAAKASNPDNRLYMTAYPLSKGWTEGGATWSEAAAGLPWDDAGATGASDHAAPVGWAWTNALGWVEFNLDPGVVAGWLVDPASNYGLLLRGEGTINRKVAYWFLSREHGKGAVHPQLLIGYNLPSPDTETFVWALNWGQDNTKHNLIKITTEGQEVFRRPYVRHAGMSVAPRDGSAWVRSQDPYEEYWEITAKLDHCGYLLQRANVSDYSAMAVDPTDGSVWIALPNERELVKLDSASQELLRVPLPVDGSPYALAIDPLDSSVWLATSYDNAIVKLDASGNMLFSDTAPGFYSSGQQQIAVDPRNGTVWYTSRDVVIKRQSDGSNPLTLTGFDTPIGVAVDSRDGSAWIADLGLNGSGMVIKFDENGSELFRISVGAPPHGIAVDGDDGSAWVGIEGALVKLSANGTELLRVPTIGWPQNIVVANVPVLECRPDSDGDLVPDEEDVCPYDPQGWRDTDGDGVCNGRDNCPDVPNPGQENADGDVLGDACEWPNEPVFKNGYDLHEELRKDLGAIVGDQSSADVINNHGQVAGVFDTQDGRHAFLWVPGQGAVDLGTFGGGWSSVEDMNEWGQVVGYSHLATEWRHAFLWTPEQGMIDLGAYPALSSEARCINNLGQVAGRVQIDPQSWSPFFWSEETGMVELPVPLPGPTWHCAASDINDRGHVTVNCGDWDQQVAYVWSPDGAVMPLPTLGGDELWAPAINNHDYIVGYSTLPTGESRPFLWSEQGGMEDLGSLGGGYGEARDINDRGEVTGVSVAADWNMHPFVWTREEGMIDLAAGIPENIWDAYVSDISEFGQVVGYVGIEGFSDHHASVWTRESGLMDLGTLGGIISAASSVNDLGQAVGWAENDFNITPWEGQRHAVLWTIEPLELSCLR